MKKKAQLAQLGGMVTALVAVAIVLVVGFLIMAQAFTQADALDTVADFTNVSQCVWSATCNATQEVRGAMDDIPAWLPIIIVTMIGAILIGMVAYFKAR